MFMRLLSWIFYRLNPTTLVVVRLNGCMAQTRTELRRGRILYKAPIAMVGGPSAFAYVVQGQDARTFTALVDRCKVEKSTGSETNLLAEFV